MTRRIVLQPREILYCKVVLYCNRGRLAGGQIVLQYKGLYCDKQSLRRLGLYFNTLPCIVTGKGTRGEPVSRPRPRYGQVRARRFATIWPLGAETRRGARRVGAQGMGRRGARVSAAIRPCRPTTWPGSRPRHGAGGEPRCGRV